MAKWSNVHPDAPVDDQGRPVHPDDDRDHLICAHTKSDRTSPTHHGRERDDVPYCTLAAAWGVEDEREGHCRKHGAQRKPQRGRNNPNWKHGLYAEIDESRFTDDELALLEVLDETDEIAILEQLIRIHALRYRRVNDSVPTAVIDRIVNPQTGDARQRVSQLEKDVSQLGGRLASLIATYKKITEGDKLSIDGAVEHSGEASLVVEWRAVDDADDVDLDDDPED